MPRKRDDSDIDAQIDERLTEKAFARAKAALTRVEDYHAQVIVAKENGTPLAVIFTNEHGTHVMAISDQLNHSWPGVKNYVMGQHYIETLAQEVKRLEDESQDNV